MNLIRHSTIQIKGFTLIELMMVVAIIGILSNIALPKFADMIRRSREAATKGNLGSIRSAITVYYSENEGQYPLRLESLTEGRKYLSIIPPAWTVERGYQSTVVNEDPSP